MKLTGYKGWMSKCEKLFLCLIVLLGALLRLIYLGQVPRGMHQDEVFVAWNAFALWKEGMDSAGNVYPVYLADWGDGHSVLYSYLLIPLYSIVGEANITPFITRLPQAFIGILTLVAFYLLIKKMFGKRFGTWALFLLAVCPWHITMCRWGLDANLAPAFLVFGLLFFVLGLDNNKYLISSALLYGIGLYSYAVIWPIVPVMLLLQIAYGVWYKKLKINKWSIISVCLLALLALPLLLFVYVNAVGEQINLPFMTIPVMSGYRADELAISFGQMWMNIRRVITLLWRQNIGAPHDILLPYGLFFDVGRIFIVVGFVALVINMIKKLIKKEFSYEIYIFIQLIGAGIVSALVQVNLHQVNCLFIPLIMCETYGVGVLLQYFYKKRKSIGVTVSAVVAIVYVVCIIMFERDYFGRYSELVAKFYAAGMEDAVEYAMQQGDEIVVEKGAQWPRILLFSRTTPTNYLQSVQYAVKPAPAQFSDGENTFYIGIDYENIDKEKVYIIYFIDEPIFEDFELKQFEDWFVAVPK